MNDRDTSALDSLIRELEDITKCFVEGNSLTGLFLQSEDQALFKQKIMEATALLDDLIGANNRYSINIINTVNQGSGGFMGGPSLNCVREVIGILKASKTQISRGVTAKSKVNNYISETRLKELRSITSQKYDLARLIRMLEEINDANEKHSYISIGLLCRAIIDHVPPIFMYKSFSEVANNYKGSKSFKGSMLHLENSLRKISDSHLHTQIRDREVLPTFHQVDFRADIDVLLAEIVRIL
jgi:hypothetical protein